MNRRYIILFLSAAGILSASADSRRDLLDSIVAHNTALAAARQQVASGQAANRAGLLPADPEVELAYLWGTPGGVSARKDFSVSQELDWGWLTGRRRRMAGLSDTRLEREYGVRLRAVLAEADRAIVTLTYYNRLCRELAGRKAVADEIQALYAGKQRLGDADAVAQNKAALNAAMAAAELQRAESGRAEVLATLRRLNGGRPVAYADTVYADGPLPPLADFLQQVRASHPEVAAAGAAIEEGRARVRLEKALALPALTVGFTGEYIGGENHSGVSVGLSLPLWGGGRRRVAQEKAALLGAQLERADALTRLSTDVEERYAAALRLRRTAERLRAGLARADNAALLRKALSAGRLSLLDYLLEMSFCYSARTQLLEAERDAFLARSSLLTMLP